MNDFKKICAMLAARRCYEAGQSVAEIAKSAGRSKVVICRWLKKSGTVLRSRYGYVHQLRLSARRCYDSGQSVDEIAKSVKRSKAVVYRWLNAAGTSFRPRQKDSLGRLI